MPQSTLLDDGLLVAAYAAVREAIGWLLSLRKGNVDVAKVAAEAAKTVQDTLGGVIEELRAQVVAVSRQRDDCHERLAEQDKRIEAQGQRIDDLSALLAGLAKPVAPYSGRRTTSDE